MSERTRKEHRDLYKAKTPPWKETYRKRCLERLRESRGKLQDRFRKINNKEISKDDDFIGELMKNELRSLQKSAKDSKDIHDEEMIEAGDIDIDSVLALFTDIQEELKKEEMALLQEFEIYEESLRREEHVLCTAIERLCTEEVICPVCKINPLFQNKCVIFCKCGLRLDTEQDCLTLANVKRNLESNIQQHGDSCGETANFTCVQDYGCDNLLMSCQVNIEKYILGFSGYLRFG
ncbi:hypothetical protein FSP39_010327 [Pinctada imbricata]|uniref:RPA-interacting protein n=1 Tax=Pinctada imbricata TaxID=66713 RepID=A0AA89BM22_PINIB|nr:hypothetical protein FSP39_010327 [Pinctada imbricata]